MTFAFTAREVAELASVPVRLVDKAVEEHVLTGRRAPVGPRRRRLLPLHAVPYTAIISRLPVTLSLSAKRDLARTLCGRAVEQMTTEPVELAPAVMVDVAALVGRDLAERAARYAQARQAYIEENNDILGGTPVIRGTRLTVYAVLGRVMDGDAVEELLEDYPQLDREAIETAILYARTHPLVGRPGGRPWTNAA